MKFNKLQYIQFDDAERWAEVCECDDPTGLLVDGGVYDVADVTDGTVSLVGIAGRYDLSFFCNIG